MIELNGSARLAEVISISRRGEKVAVPAKTRAAVAQAHDSARVLSRTVPTYGRTTGVGANRSTDVAATDTEHGIRLLRSHSVDAGDPIPAVAIRAMLAVRLNQLCIPGSGIAPNVLDGLVGMLNRDALPNVLEFGSIGTGDLSALAGTALTLMGERRASRPLEPMEPWGADSALPFISSSALTLGRACLVAEDLKALSDASAIVYALSFVGLRGNRSTFSASAARASAAEGVAAIAAKLRKLLGAVGEAARIQDPYGLRAFAVVQAPLVGAISRLIAQLEKTINSAQENPLFTKHDVVHHAGFYQAGLGLILDGVALALAQTTPLALSRIRLMNEPEYTGQSPFLAAGPSGSSGVMIVEYVAAAAHGEIHASAQPSSLTTVVLSRGSEEDASFAPVAVGNLERAIHSLRVLLGCELLVAVRLLRQRGVAADQMPSKALARAVELCSRTLPADDADRDLRQDLEQAQLLLDSLADLA